jgi:hypothetical protein
MLSVLVWQAQKQFTVSVILKQLSILAVTETGPFWRPCSRKQFYVLAWQAQKQFSVLAILKQLSVLALPQTGFRFGTLTVGNSFPFWHGRHTSEEALCPLLP